jgi:deoxyadenosine/deoxycytidine kinase
MPIISLEGNIGAGKSTLFNQLRAAHPEWIFVDEPVDEWMRLVDSDGKSLLENFYGDRKRWAYTFQITALLSRSKALTAAYASAGPEAIIVTERSLGADKNVFAKMLNADGDIGALEWTLYNNWFDQITKTLPPISGYIHLDTPVTICDERIAVRAREGESVPVDYLDRLDSYHFAWLLDTAMPAPVMRYDNYSLKDQSSLKDVEEFVERLLAPAPAPAQN